MMTLTRELRRLLESTVREARRTAEAGALKSIEQLAVHHHEPWPGMTAAQRDLRNRLRAHGRQLGDRRDEQRGVQAIDRLKAECAYEHWHRLLFARFLAETELLIEPQSGIAITLSECEELARDAGRDWLEVAAEYAQRMLPQIFRNGDPVLEVALPPETRSTIEDLMKALPRDVFVADDSLGWVYQFWQADRKDEINRSEKKIGADELPAVTQLFTEDYMVFFLLHNTLGAWWAGKVLAANPGLAASAADEDELRTACALADTEWAYLRFVRDGEALWRPAAGTFDGWPKAAKDITLLDPCMGSGHFLVFALPMLAAMRAAEEHIAPEAAIEVVLRENLFGLEIDPRCTQIAAFNLALAAWRRTGYRQLPTLHLACSGLSLSVTKSEWLKLAERATQQLPLASKNDPLVTEDNQFTDAMKRGFERLYDVFERSPWLGSLVNPRNVGGDLIEYGFEDLDPILAKVMASAGTAEVAEMAVAARGIAKASEILAQTFVLVSTNVPYLGRNKHDQELRTYCDQEHSLAKADLATCFLERCYSFCDSGGAIALITPQNWWFQPSSTGLREWLLSQSALRLLATLGEEAWQSFGDRGPVASILIASRQAARAGEKIACVDALPRKTIEEKVVELRVGDAFLIGQEDLEANPDSRLSFAKIDSSNLLAKHCDSWHALVTSDNPRFMMCFWEAWGNGWEPYISSPAKTRLYGGREYVVAWMNGSGPLHHDSKATNFPPTYLRDRKGVLLSQVRSLASTIFTGEIFAHGSTPIIPHDQDLLPALWAFLSSSEYQAAVRKVDNKLAVTSGTLLKVEFDRDRWIKIAQDQYPAGLPKPHSDDPTQWLFNGNPNRSAAPLQVAVARLVGFQWPRQVGAAFLDCPALTNDGLDGLAASDGIVALDGMKGEQSGVARLTAMLARAFSNEWSAAKLDNLLAQVGFAGASLDVWLRDAFFEQHCELFHQRPFVWHVWDGRRDGFHALVNYRRLAAPNGEGRRTLEKLIYSYLGDWLDRQRAEQKAGVEGADSRVAAAEHLRTELTNILAGDPPYDIFVRWKPLHQQPLGWEPDINDGVRINIRPFIVAKPLGARARGACVLRSTPKVKWDKDRGKEPPRPSEDFPWLWNWDQQTLDFEGRGKEPDGNRWNDLHYTRTFKEAARARKGKGWTS